jgi:hypothetical protein
MRDKILISDFNPITKAWWIRKNKMTVYASRMRIDEENYMVFPHRTHRLSTKTGHWIWLPNSNLGC